MINATLADKLAAWATLRGEANALEADIKQEVLALGGTITVGRARATFNSGRTTYDYETIAGAMDVDDDTKWLYSDWVTNWKKVCEELAASDDDPDVLSFFKEEYHKQAKPSVTLKILNK